MYEEGKPELDFHREWVDDNVGAVRAGLVIEPIIEVCPQEFECLDGEFRGAVAVASVAVVEIAQKHSC